MLHQFDTSLYTTHYIHILVYSKWDFLKIHTRSTHSVKEIRQWKRCKIGFSKYQSIPFTLSYYLRCCISMEDWIVFTPAVTWLQQGAFFTWWQGQSNIRRVFCSESTYWMVRTHWYNNLYWGLLSNKWGNYF